MTERYVPVLAVGAGPANLAFAVAAEEMAKEELAADLLLVEAHHEVVWQRGMLLPWTQSQVGYLKDLVTLRNPRSKFSFVNFLHSVGRLDEFVNLGAMTPYRQEISKYLQWVAASLETVRTEYGVAVRRIEGVRSPDSGLVEQWRAQLSNGDTVYCRDVVIGIGRHPYVPAEFIDLPAHKVIHSSEFASRVRQLDPATTRRCVVVGGAQSAAEMLWAVYQAFPAAECTMLMRSIGLRGYESSKFTNELYYPSFVDEFYRGTPEIRGRVLQEMHRTNYAGLEPGLLDQLYRQMYVDRLSGTQRMKMQTLTEILSARMDGDEVVLTIADRLRSDTYELRCDVVMLGTGFQKDKPALIRRLAESVGVREIAVERHYRMVLPEFVTAGCYLQGVNEETHGIADSLMSVLAVRAGEMVTDLVTRHRQGLGTAAVPAGAAAARSVHGEE